MVKLPDCQDLGAVPRLDARVPIARPDASPIARGAEQLGQGIARLGQSVGQFALAQAQYQNALARGNREADVIGLKQQYAEDADYASLPQRFDADLKKLTQQHAETIDDASMRQRFLADAAQLNASHRAWADQQAFAIGKDAQKADLDQAGQNFINAAGSTADEAAHQRLIEAMNASLDRAEKLGILGREEAMQRRAAFTDQFLSVDTFSQIDRAIAAGDAEKLDQIVAGLRVSRDRTGHGSANGSAADGQGQQAADAAQRDAPPLGEPGGHFDMLSPAAREHLIGYATQRQQAAVIDRQRGLAQQQAQIQQASDQREDQLLQDIAGPNPQATAQSIVGDPALTPQASARLIAFLGRNETVSPQASHVAAMGLLAKMRPNYGGADKIGDLAPLYDAAFGDKIDTGDFNFLRGELASLRTADGEVPSRRQAEFMEEIAPIIETSSRDQSDAGRQLRTYEFAHALSDEIARYRDDGKNPFDLFRRLPNESDQEWAARATGGRLSVEPPTPQVAAASAPRASEPPNLARNINSEDADANGGSGVGDSKSKADDAGYGTKGYAQAGPDQGVISITVHTPTSPDFATYPTDKVSEQTAIYNEIESANTDRKTAAVTYHRGGGKYGIVGNVNARVLTNDHRGNFAVTDGVLGIVGPLPIVDPITGQVTPKIFGASINVGPDEVATVSTNPTSGVVSLVISPLGHP